MDPKKSRTVWNRIYERHRQTSILEKTVRHRPFSRRLSDCRNDQGHRQRSKISGLTTGLWWLSQCNHDWLMVSNIWTRRRMARERRRAFYSLLSSIKDTVGESFIEDDADDQQKGDRNQQKQTKIDTNFERPTETDSKETHTHTDTQTKIQTQTRTHTGYTDIHNTHTHKQNTKRKTHTHTQRHRHTRTQRDRHGTHKQTRRQTPGHTHTLTHTHSEVIVVVATSLHEANSECCTFRSAQQTLSNTDPFTHKPFYTQTILYTDALMQRRFYATTLLHTDPFTHKPFYTQTLVHANTFMQKRVCTQMLLQTDAFTHITLYAQKLLHADAFTHRCFYTHKLQHTGAFTHRCFHTQKRLRRDTFTHTHKRFYTQTLLHTDDFTHRCFYAQTLLHTKAFTSVFDTRPPFRAKGLRFDLWNRNFTSVKIFDTIISCERVVRKLAKSQFYCTFGHQNVWIRAAGCQCHVVIQKVYHVTMLPQFLAIEPHFARKGCRGTFKIAI